MRINLDMLHTRRKEDILLAACVQAKQAFVVGNTNPSAEVRSKYFEVARPAGFRVIGYYFVPDLHLSLARNLQRAGKECIPEVAISALAAKLQPPILEEGFDEIFLVTINEESEFVVEPLLR